MPTLALVLLAALPLRAADAPRDIPQAQTQARQAIQDADPRGLAALRRELDGLADELDALQERRRPGEQEEEPMSLRELSEASRAAIEARRPRADARLKPGFDALDAFYRDLPGRTYAEAWGEDLQRIVAEQLRWSGERASSVDDLNASLVGALKLPKKLPTDADVEDLAFWPVEVPLREFKKLDPIRVFLLKHRLRRPKSYAATTAASIVDGRHNVEAGVIVEGVVTRADGKVFDQDYCFNVGDLHVEITPEWRLLHRHTYLPKPGDRVRLKGWTYYDYFHKAEHEWDPKDPVMGDARFTLWEIHPLQEVEKLP